MTPPIVQPADLLGATRLATDAVTGLTDLVEAMHARIASLPRLRGAGEAAAQDERTRGITGLVYKTVRGVTRLAGGSAEALLGWLAGVLGASGAGRLPHPEREALVSALNGVLGDHLAATLNPLAITMSLRQSGRPLVLEPDALPSGLRAASPKVLVLIHGLCMSDLQWQRKGHDHGQALASHAGYTPVYLHYNTGLPVSTNGRLLAHQMERLCQAWPVPIERLVLLGYSMGGLVARSALHHGSIAKPGALQWPALVQDYVSLGTPHHGAPLERGGRVVDRVLGAAPYAGPLARIGRVRSAGIRDLRFGHLRGVADADGGAASDAPVPLPAGVRCHAIAGSLGPHGQRLKARLLGDGLVPVASALGQHADPQRRLAFAADRQAVVHDTDHLDLLSSAEVQRLLRSWLA